MSAHNAENDAPCCVPAEGDEHCAHHPEWHGARGCNHPECCVTPPVECDCDYWHSKHRWHCATNYGARVTPPEVTQP